MKNIFIYGMSGAGKDTIANSIRNYYGYLKLRIAGTIKQYIFETYGFKSQEEFEEAKRTNPEVRKMHNIIGNEIDLKGKELSGQNGSLNRLDQLLNRTSLEFEIHYNMNDKPLCIIDVRTIEEAKKCFDAGLYGIFLNRRSTEFADKTHKTEQDIFLNGQLSVLFSNKNYREKSIIFLNDDYAYHNKIDVAYKINEKYPDVSIIITDGTAKQLENFVKIAISCDFDHYRIEENVKNYQKNINK